MKIEKLEIWQEYLFVFRKTALNIDLLYFKEVLQESLSNVTIKESFLIYKNEKFNCLISQKNKGNEEYVFFIICISGKEEQLALLNELVVTIDSWINENNNNPKKNIQSINYLWDGVSFYYSKIIYPSINYLENYARKFITCHVQIKLQAGQPSETASKFIEKHTKNWIDPANFLFIPDIDIKKIESLQTIAKKQTQNHDDKKIKRIETAEAIKKLYEQTKTGLERLFPEQQFNTAQDDMYKKWSDLQKFRDAIAHNQGHLRKDDIESVEYLVSFFKEKFDEISKLCQCTDEAITNDQAASHLQSQDENINNTKLVEAEAELWEQLNAIKTTDYDDMLKEELKNKQYKQGKGVLVDTNEAYGEGSIWDMFSENYIALYGDRVDQLHYLNKGDIVFLYFKGVGIIAAAEVVSDEITPWDDWCHSKPVKFLTKRPDIDKKSIDKFIPVRKIREFTGKNFFWARTLKVPYLSSDEANNLLEKIIPILGKADDTDS